MFILGHLGIGSKIVSPWTRGLPKKAVFLGTLLPDLIDKPLYYGLSALTGKHGAELGLICGTRTFGHTALFLIATTATAYARRSLWLAALSLGIASHLLLDNISDTLRQDVLRSAMVALVWPLDGWHFVPILFQNFSEHFAALFHRVTVWGEIIGASLLAWDGWKIANEREILSRDTLRGRFKRLRKRRD